MKKLECASMKGEECDNEVTMIDKKGFIYCSECGMRRRSMLVPCRKLLKREIKQLKQGLTISKY